MDGQDFRFLFRQGEGTIPASVWRRWTIVLTGLCLAMAALWAMISPWTRRDLASQGLFDTKAFLAFVYLLFFAVTVLLTQASQYNLSTKRLRAKNHGPGWAAVWPLTAFVAGAAFWAQPNFFGLMPAFLPWLFLLAALAAFGAQFFELGIRPD